MTRLGVITALLPLLGACYGDPAPRVHIPEQASLRLLERVQSALETGDSNEALSLARAAYDTDPEYDDAAWIYATLLGRSGKIDEALEICSLLGARSPAYVQAHLLEGILWEQKGNRESANLAYDRALSGIAASDTSALSMPELRLYEAVTIYLRRGKLAGVQAINQVLEVFPDYPPAHYVKTCMLDKNRGFLMRWFSDGGPHPEATATQDIVTKD